MLRIFLTNQEKKKKNSFKKAETRNKVCIAPKENEIYLSNNLYYRKITNVSKKNMDKPNRFSDEFLERHRYEADEEDNDYEPSVNYSESINSFMNMIHDANNPLLQPIHGVSLEDYAVANVANGMSNEQVWKNWVLSFQYGTKQNGLRTITESHSVIFKM